MKILQICNNFTANRLYLNLFNEISKHEYHQEIIAPIRKFEEFGAFHRDCACDKIHYPFIVKNIWDRFFFRRKTRKALEYVVKKIRLDKVDVSHAHTLFSDGAIAYELFKRYEIPYVVAVRNTDITPFLKYMPYLRKYGLAILEAAKKVIFISDSYHKHLNLFFPGWCQKNSFKLKTISNGIDSFWLKNRNTKNAKSNFKYKLIFSGDFNFNKNIHGLIIAIIEMHKLGHFIEFEAIGLGRPNEEKKYVEYLTQLSADREYIKFSQALPKELLLEKFRDSDIFVMPSFSETFGLVYAEALSQGLPLIYSKGQGFDGIFRDGIVGKSVDARNICDIRLGIESVMSYYDTMVKNIAHQPLNKLFDWSNIAMLYCDLYSSLK